MKYLKYVLGGVALTAALATTSAIIYNWWKNSGKVSIC